MQPFSVSKPVGADRKIAPKDTLTLKTALHNLGLYDPPERGLTDIPDMAMIDGLKQFQSKNGLSADGVMKPGGPTEQLLKAAVRERQTGTSGGLAQLGLSADIGENAPNRPEDVRTARRALNAVGYASESEGSPGNVDRELLGNIRLFKQDFNLGDSAQIKINDAASSVLARVSHAILERTQERPRSEHAHERQTRPQLAEGLVTLGRQPEEIAATNKRIAQRKSAILNNRLSSFEVKPNPRAKPNRPRFERPSESQVNQFDAIIASEAKKGGVDPDLVRSIVYLETSGGWYDKYFEPFEANRSLRPMNIQASYWQGLGFSREDLKDPRKNIQAGVKLLKAIQDRIPNSTIEQIASVYHYLGATIVNDYGVSIARFYREKPWLQ